ncbi:hypothetical protein GCM10025772_12110 [Ferrimonas gelatinilytica]|uniref:Transposase n=1 Tax=Ferrimonas gelatinilytica TaxID=1255257 RepID=A0ABP9RZH6_9GAMM
MQFTCGIIVVYQTEMNMCNSKGQFEKNNTVARAKRGYKDRDRQLARWFTDSDIHQVY